MTWYAGRDRGEVMVSRYPIDEVASTHSTYADAEAAIIAMHAPVSCSPCRPVY